MSELLPAWPVGFVIASLMMTPLAPFLMALTLLPACSEPLESQSPALPSHFGAPGSHPLTDALLVWVRGASYINDSPEETDELAYHYLSGDEFAAYIARDYPRSDNVRPFKGIDYASAEFLDHVRPRNAAPHDGCYRTIDSAERLELNLEEALRAQDPLLRLQALVLLISVRAPRSVAAQWRALCELEAILTDPLAVSLLASLRAEFTAERLGPLLDRQPPHPCALDKSTRHKLGLWARVSPRAPSKDVGEQWALRAIGVAGLEGLIPRLRQSALHGQLSTSRAAELSLEEIQGPAADAALLECVLSLKDRFCQRAATELARRCPDLLEKALLAGLASGQARSFYALNLGYLGNTLAVPILCERLGYIPHFQRSLYLERLDLIEELATEEHRDLINSLPGRVHRSQRSRALAVRKAVLTRLNND